MSTSVLVIGEHFSDDPAGRYYTDGDGNGEEFREEILKPIFHSTNSLTINIDKNVEGYGSSFLVEAFGGLVKHGYFKNKELLNKLSIEYDDPDYAFYAKKIRQYIKEAKFNSVEYRSTKNEAIEEKLFNNTIDKQFVKDFIY